MLIHCTGGTIELERLTEFFQVLSDPTRLRILSLLQEHELCVCQLMAVLEMQQSRVSQQLGVLRRAGLLSSTRKGKWVYYRLRSELPDPYVAQVLAGLPQRLSGDPVLEQDRSMLLVCGEAEEITGTCEPETFARLNKLDIKSQ